MEPKRGRTSIETNPSKLSSLLKEPHQYSLPSLDGNELKAAHQKELQQRKYLQLQLQKLKSRMRWVYEQRYQNRLKCMDCLKNPLKPGEWNQQMSSFAKNIDLKLCKVYSSMRSNLGQLRRQDNSELYLIQNFAVFGIPEQVLSGRVFQQESDNYLDGKKVFSLFPPTDSVHQAASLVFPSGITAKKINIGKVRHKVSQLISKSYTSQNSFLIGLQQEQKRLSKLSPTALKLLNMINPTHKLFCVCIGTIDFTFLSKLGTNIHSYSGSKLPETEVAAQRVSSEEKIPNLHQASSMEALLDVCMSQRVYCITSYFPFFRFLQDILTSLLSAAKVERLQLFQLNVQNIRSVDSKFHLKRIQKIFDQFLMKLTMQPVRINSLINVHMPIETLTLKTTKEHLLQLSLYEWLYEVLSLFTMDTFIDVFMLLVLEQHLVFVCQNSHILTYVIYLFAEHLYKPFKYAFHSVYIVPTEQFLDAPFPTVFGLLKKNKWLTDNRIMEKYTNNNYIFLSPSGVNIVYSESSREKLKKKPDKLKNLLGPVFKQLDKHKKDFKKNNNLKAQDITEYVAHSTYEQKELSLRVVNEVNRFVEEEVYKHIPSGEALMDLKRKIEKEKVPESRDAHTHLMERLVEHICQSGNQGQFFERIMQTQTINMFLSEKCGFV